MKHCPECNKNYADPTLSFCLDDGSRLVYGPAVEEPETIILRGDAAAEAQTRATDSPSIGELDTPPLPKPGASASSKSTKFAWVLGVLAVAAILAFVFGYRYYSSARSRQVESVAVLPFANQSGNQDLEYISDGMTESVIRTLSQLPNLKVMSRTSVFHYKGKEINAQTVAKELNVQAVLTGTVSQRGDSLSTSVELIDPQDNSQIWSQQYTHKMSDVFALQEEIAKEISNRLRIKLSGEERQQLAKRPTENLKAFQYYMQGQRLNQRRTREDLLTAVSLYEKAIAEDRNYALAYAGLADAYANLGLRGYIAPVDGRRKADEAARRSLELDANLAETHVAFAQSYMQFAPYDFSLSDGELRRALELSPSSANAHQYLGFSLLKQGALDAALEEALRARELDPLSSIIAREVALTYYLKRDYKAAFDLLRQADELGPSMSTQWEIGMYIQNGAFNDALAELAKAQSDRKTDPILIFSSGMVHAAQGRRLEALQVIKELEAMSGPNLDEAHWIAKIYAALNERGAALDWLERGVRAGAIGGFYKDEPVWDPVRSDSRFGELLRQMNVPQ
jgi:TolB-like protein/Flp pilus assembly protein TadD